MIRKNRIKNGFSQSYLAKKLGVSQSYISKLENNTVDNINKSLVLKLSIYLGVEYTTLIDWLTK